MTEVTQADRDFRSAILKHIADAIGRPCVEGDTIDGRQNTLDEIIARHRTTAEAAKDARIKELEAELAARLLEQPSGVSG